MQMTERDIKDDLMGLISKLQNDAKENAEEQSAMILASKACEACVCSALEFIDGTRSLSQLSLKCAASSVSATQPVLPRCTSND